MKKQTVFVLVGLVVMVLVFANAYIGNIHQHDSWLFIVRTVNTIATMKP